MKIVLVHNTYREPGGEDVVFENEKRLLERAGHTVVAYLRSNWELDDGTLLHRMATVPRMIWSSSVRREFAGVLDDARPDIVHVHNTFMAISPSIYSACAERGIPVVQSLHNFRLLCPGGNFFRDGAICHECADHGLLRSVRHGCYRGSRAATGGVATMLAFHRALTTWHSVSRFIALTEFARQKFIASGFPPRRVAVKPNFVDPDPGERSGVGGYALFVGRLVENKGLRTLLQAWKRLPAQCPLQIVGDGPDRAALEAEAHALKLSSVSFWGRLPGADVIEAVKGSRFLILPSTLYEGFPMCIAESFACGTPVVCSRLGGLAEIVEHEITGLHFAPGDPGDLAEKARWAWDHPAELEKMGRAARRKYETNYTAGKNYSQLVDIYERVLSETTAPRPTVATTTISQSAMGIES